MKIIVLAGGLSPERDVSLTSGAGICKTLRERGHQAFLLDVFFGLPYPSEKLSEVFELPGAGLRLPTALKPPLQTLRHLSFPPGSVRMLLRTKCRRAVPVGRYHIYRPSRSVGENGKIQATFDILGIKYTGPNSLGCSLSMNKLVAKQIFKMSRVLPPAALH